MNTYRVPPSGGGKSTITYDNELGVRPCCDRDEPAKCSLPGHVYDVYMGTKNVRLDDDVYARVKAAKREDESMSDTIDRLIGGGSILDLYGISTDKDVEGMREAIEESKSKGRDRVAELRERAHNR